jgi:hypothetical protein
MAETSAIYHDNYNRYCRRMQSSAPSLFRPPVRDPFRLGARRVKVILSPDDSGFDEMAQA